jgi:hypothetical protein
MMKKKWIKWIIGLVCASNLMALASIQKNEVTLVLMPREKTLQKVGIDLSKRYTLLFITYKIQPSGAISLHGWTGSGWVNITPKDYVAGTFFKNGPTSTLIIEKENVPVPPLLIPPKTWCEKVVKIKTTQLRPLLHLTGRYFNFNYKYWSYFSQRAALPISDINPENHNIPWYQKSLKKEKKPSLFSLKQDMQYWEIIRKPAPPKPIVVPKKKEVPTKQPVEKKKPEPKTKEQPPKKAETPIKKETPKKPKANPFKEPLPPAAVFGAGNVLEVKEEKKP